MDHFSELNYLKHLLGPEEIDRRRSVSEQGRTKAPTWLFPLLVVFALYGVTFTIGFLVSNHAENVFAVRGDQARLASLPANPASAP